MEVRYTQRVHLVVKEVLQFHRKIKDKDANTGRDIFVLKTGFNSLPFFG